MSGVSYNVPAALPARYYWHAAVPAANRDVRQDDPSQFPLSTDGTPSTAIPAQCKNRPAIGVIAGVTGNLAYVDSRGQTQLIPGMVVGQYYAADIQQIIGTGGKNIVPAETGTGAAVASTAYKLTLFWGA
jgi:hypothetical protein